MSYAREILRAFGIPQRGPTFVGSDNKANALLSPPASLYPRVPVTAYAVTLPSYNAYVAARSRLGTSLTLRIRAIFLRNGSPRTKATYPYGTLPTYVTLSTPQVCHQITMRALLPPHSHWAAR